MIYVLIVKNIILYFCVKYKSIVYCVDIDIVVILDV